MNSKFCLFLRYFTRKLIWYSQSSIRPSKKVFCYLRIIWIKIEPKCFPLRLGAKQGKHWYHCFNVFGMTQPLSGIERWTSCTLIEHSITRLSRRLSWHYMIDMARFNKNIAGSDECFPRYGPDRHQLWKNKWLWGVNFVNIQGRSMVLVHCPSSYCHLYII